MSGLQCCVRYTLLVYKALAPGSQQSVAWLVHTDSMTVTDLTKLCMHEGVCLHIFPGVGVGPPGVAGAK